MARSRTVSMTEKRRLAMSNKADEVMRKLSSTSKPRSLTLRASSSINRHYRHRLDCREPHTSYKKMPDVEIVAAADLIPGKAEAFMKKFGVEGVRFYPSHKELIDNEQLDGVSICTYNTAHKEPTIYALEHGVNVLLEKPFTVTLDEAIEVCRAEKKSGKILTIGFQPRNDANMKMIKRIVESGALGKIYYIQTGGGRRRGIPNSTFIEKSTGGIGALGDIGCYSLDMVLNAIGYPKPLTVSGLHLELLWHQSQVRDA